MKVWVDDIRPAPFGWVQCVNSFDAIEVLKFLQRSTVCTADAISLDHDLGGEDTTRPVVLWMIENNFWPIEVKVHSANPVGVEWLEGMIERYNPNGY